MGAVKSLTHSYSANQYLLWYIEKGDIDKLEALLSTKPHLVNESLSVNYKSTPLHRAATNGNLPLVQLLLQKYDAQIDLQTSAGETALIGAIKRDRVEIVEYLLSKRADITVTSGYGLAAVDYAVLQGLYSVALLLCESSTEVLLKTPLEYQDLASRFKYRYVNYQLFLDAITRRIRPQNAPNFLVKEQKRLEDPIADPRETWKEWFKRNLEFRDPPMVERSEVPEQLQPQNRTLGGLRHTLTKWALSPLSQEVSLHPRSQSQALSDCKMHEETGSVNLHSVKVNPL